MIDAIKQYLIDTGITNTIYIGFLPPMPHTAICLYETPAFAPDPKYQYNTRGTQVRVRATDYADARNLIWSIYTRLQSGSSATRTVNLTGGYFLLDTQAQQDPFSLGQDEMDRAQFVQNFIFEYVSDLAFRS